jgi:hypothetical protein
MAWVGGAYRAVFVLASIRTVFVPVLCIFATCCARLLHRLLLFSPNSLIFQITLHPLTLLRFALTMQDDSHEWLLANQMDFPPPPSQSSYPVMGFEGYAGVG